MTILQGILVGVALAACLAMYVRMRRVAGRMEREHREAMRMLTSDRDEMEAALSSMVEAVLAVDTGGRLISFNEAASGLLGITRERHAGLPFAEAVGVAGVREFIGQTLGSSRSLVTDIELSPTSAGTGGEPGEPARLFQATGSALRHRGGPRIGSLIVLHDVTRLRRLEVVRRDFVSNASHEIRTPVAAIKMAADALGEEGESIDPASAQRFVAIIGRQADRLQALIDDLLSLTRIERDAEERRIELREQALAGVLRSAAETSQTAASGRRTRIEVECPEELSARINGPLLEQAVTNLLDNAVKYSPEGSAVRCRGYRFNHEVIVSVSDEGVGIEAEHLPRVFERFYRTDAARSREMGGTGLGLSIVRHVALAHGGRVTVDSQVGKGSTFRLHLPGGIG